MLSGGSRQILGANAAWLTCGQVLTYEARSFVPQVGEVVPCHRHGYCRVIDTERVRDQPWRRGPRRSPRRSQEELLDFLNRNPVTSLNALRKRGFSLRMVTAAQREASVDVDVITGRIAGPQSTAR